MANNPTKQDIQLLIRAQDTSPKTLQQVAENVGNLTSTIEQQAAAADKGQTSLKELNDSYSQLEKVSKSLIAQQGQISLFRDLSQQLSDAKDKATTARQAMEQFKQTLGEETSRDDTKTLRALTKEADAADKAVARLTTRVTVQADKLQTYGISVENLAEEQTKLVNTAKQVGDAVGTASNAIENYAENLKRAKQAAADLEAAEAIRAKGEAAQAAINEAARPVRPTGENAAEYVRMLTEALNEQEAALKKVKLAQEAENASLAEFYAQQKKNMQGFNQGPQNELSHGGIGQTAQQYQESLNSIGGFFDQIKEKEDKLAEDKKLQEKLAADLASFQKVAEAAQAAAKGYETIATASVASPQTGKSSISAILDPSAAARNTLQGAVDQVQGVASNIAEDSPIEKYTAQIKALGDAQRALVSQAGLIDQIKAQQEAFASANAKLEQNREELIRLSTAAKESEVANEEMTAAMKAQQSQLSGNYAAVAREAEALEKLKQAAAAAGLNLENLDGELAKLTAAANTSVEAQTKLRAALDKSSHADTGKSLFGLQGYQLNYLAYDLKSVLDQLGAGAHISQIFGEHVGQLLVVWPKAMTTILAYSQYLVPAAGAFYTLYAAIDRVVQTEEAIRHWNGVLAQSADGARYSAKAIAEQQRELQNLGASFEEAGRAFQIFMQKGLPQSQFLALGKAALDLSDVMGVKLPDAAKQISEAFHGNMADIDKLDEQYNFLTEAQRKHIQALFDEGHAQEARTEAARLFEENEDRAAQKARGPWTDAVREFQKAWHDLLDEIANSPSAAAALKVLKLLTEGLAGLANAIRKDGVVNNPSAASSADLETERKRLEDYDKQQQDTVGGGFLQFNRDYSGRFKIQADLKAINDELAKRTKNYDAIQQAAQAAGKKEQEQNDSTQRALKDRDKLEREIYDRRVSERNTNIADAQRVKAAYDKAYQQAAHEHPDAGDAAYKEAATAAAEDEQNKIDRRTQKQVDTVRKSSEALAAELSQMYATIDKEQKTDLDSQLRAIDEKYAAIFSKISEFKRLPGAASQLISGMNIDQFTASIEAAKNELKAQAELKVDEASVNDLLKERENIFAAINLQVQNGTKSVTDGYQAAQDANAKLSPMIADAAKKAADFAEKIRGARPDPQLTEAISKYRSVQAGEQNPAASKSPIGQETKSLTDDAFKPINELAKARETEIKSITDLQAAGAITATEAEQKIQAAYDRTTEAIKKQAAELQMALDLQKAAGTITPEAYDLATNKLKLTVAQTENLNSETARLRKTGEQAFSQGIVTFADSATDSIGQAIAGTKSWGDAFKSVEGAALSFFATFAKKIADTILQTYALKAATSLIGAFGGLGSSAATGSTAVLGTASTGQAILHSGGLVGPSSTRTTRPVDPRVFIGAPRYHSGSVGIGLASDEQAAILQHGEQVLAKNDPRNTLNNIGKQSGQGQPMALRQVLAIGDAQIAQAMQGAAGEETFLTHLKNNVPTLKRYVGAGK